MLQCGRPEGGTEGIRMGVLSYDAVLCLPHPSLFSFHNVVANDRVCSTPPAFRAVKYAICKTNE